MGQLMVLVAGCDGNGEYELYAEILPLEVVLVTH